MHEGYFQVMAEPVSTCVHEIFDRGSRALAALRHEVVDPALPVLVAGVPVLDGRVLDLRVVEGDELDDRRVQLVLVAHRRRAALEVAHVGALGGHEQRPLELAGVRGVDAEVGAELHRAAHALRHVDEGAVGEDRGVQGGEEVVGVRDDGPQVLPHEVGVLPHRLGEGAEDDARLLELRLERGGDGDAVEDGVDRDPGEPGPLVERHARASRTSRAASGPPRRGSSARPSSASARRSTRWPGSRSAGSGRSATSAPPS